MSKKILAIALFAVMVLSLVPIANAAAPAVATGTGIQVSGLANNHDNNTDYARTSGDFTVQTGGADTVGKWSPDDGLLRAANGASPDVVDAGTLTITGDWADMHKIRATEYSSLKVPVFKFEIPFDILYDADYTYTLNGNDLLKDPGFDTSGNGKYTGYFAAAEAGNSQRYQLIVKDDDGNQSTTIFTITYRNIHTTGNPTRTLVPTFKNSGTAGDYNAQMIGGVLFIDVAQDIVTGINGGVDTAERKYLSADNQGEFALRMALRFSSNGAAIPTTNQIVQLVNDDTDLTTIEGTSGGFDTDPMFFSAHDYGMGDDGKDYTGSGSTAVTANDADYFMWVNYEQSMARAGTLANKVKITLEGEDYTYESAEIPVKWRVLPRNEITQANFDSTMTLAVGETKEIAISGVNLTTYTDSDIRISEMRPTPIVWIDGKKIRGLSVGTTTLLVEARATNFYAGTGSWKTIGTIQVTVTDPAAPPTVTPPTVTGNSYRIITRNLNVRSGPGTNFATVGQVHMNEVYAGTPDAVAGWLKIGEGRYVSMAYVTPVSGVTSGNYVTTASSLNVRTAPNGSVSTKYPKGTPVTVTTVSNGWAQLDNGLWVSMLYLAAR